VSRCSVVVTDAVQFVSEYLIDQFTVGMVGASVSLSSFTPFLYLSLAKPHPRQKRDMETDNNLHKKVRKMTVLKNASFRCSGSMEARCI